MWTNQNESDQAAEAATRPHPEEERHRQHRRRQQTLPCPTAPTPPQKSRNTATEDEEVNVFRDTQFTRSGAATGRKKQSARTGSTISDQDVEKLPTQSEPNVHQRQRRMESAVLASTAAHAVPTSIRQRGTDYHERTFGTSGNTEGPPWPHLAAVAAIAAFACTQGTAQTPFKNFAGQFCTPMTRDANSTQLQRQLAIEQVRTDGRGTTALNKELSKRELALTRDRMTLEIQVFKVRIMKTTRKIHLAICQPFAAHSSDGFLA